MPPRPRKPTKTETTTERAPARPQAAPAAPALPPTPTMEVPPEEAAAEEARLREVVSFIDEATARLRARQPLGKGNLDLLIASTMNTADLVRGLEEARPSPYFGRINFRPRRPGPSGKAVEDHYIGKNHVPERVSSWTAPVAALYYKPAATGYRAPQGYIAGRIELKREFQIKDSRIQSMADLLRLLPSGAPAAAALPAGPSSPALEKALAGAGAGEMIEAIQTIQPEQYEEIAAGEKPVMLLQGAAGSGKSLVGLHRIAYLLSPFSELGRLSRPRPNRVIMFGPSKAFLEFVSGLLPSLGHRDIRQTTLRAWILGTFSQPVQAEPADRLFAAVMDRTKALSDAAMDAERYKGSREMAALLERHVRALRRDFAAAARPVSVRPAMGEVVLLEASEVAKLIAGLNAQAPLNEARATLVEQAFQAVLAKGNFRQDIEVRNRLRTTLLPNVRAAVDRFWPAVDFRRAYARLLVKEADLVAAGVVPDIARQLALNGPREDAPFSANDLPALLYLDHLVNGIPSQGFEHIVVDEAQDVSPLEIMLLKRHSANGSFTIMGDVRQRLLPYRGIREWNELGALFEDDDLATFDSNTSYRSTEEITRFANRVLAQVPGTTPATPFPRHGEEPQPIPAADAAAMLRNVAGDVKRLQERGAASIGVLTKTRQEAEVIYGALGRQGLRSLQLLGPDDTVTAGVAVAPILLTKGLEFDAVVLAGVNKDNFTGTEFDTRLLYLGCTRAKHWLHVHWAGPASPTLR